MTAQVYYSESGKTWRVVEKVNGSTYITNHETLTKALIYCQRWNLVAIIS